MSDPFVIKPDEHTEICVWVKDGKVTLAVERPAGFCVAEMDCEDVDALIRALAAARVEIAPPTIPEKPIRNPRQPNVPDNADALARVAKSKPERIDGDEK